MENDDRLLARWVGQRDAAAFAALAQRHAGMVYGTCCRISGDHHVAEDLAQDVFLDLAQKAGLIRQSVAGFLHSAARTRALNHCRDSVVRQRHEKAASAEIVRISDEPSTWHEVKPHLDAALAKIDADERTAILLHFMEGRSQVEIAEILGVRQATVSRRISRGLEALRNQLVSSGLVLSAVSLSSLCAENAVQTAPASVLAAAPKIGLTAGGIATPVSTQVVSFLKVAGLVASLVVAVGLICLALMWNMRNFTLPKSAAASIQNATPVEFVVPEADPPVQKTEDEPVVPPEHPDLTAGMNPLQGQWKLTNGVWRGDGWTQADLGCKIPWTGKALVIEFEGCIEKDSSIGGGLQCDFFADQDGHRGNQPLDSSWPHVDISGTWLHRFPWTFLAMHHENGKYSRDMLTITKRSDFSRQTGVWYRFRIERVDRRLRLSVDDVPVAEQTYAVPFPDPCYVTLGCSVNKDALFKNVRIWTPKDEEIVKMQSATFAVFAPSVWEDEMLAENLSTSTCIGSVTCGAPAEGNLKPTAPIAPTTQIDQTMYWMLHQKGDTRKDSSKLPMILTTQKPGPEDRRLFLEIDTLDQDAGFIAAQYSSWWTNKFQFETVEVPLGNTRQARTVRLPLLQFRPKDPFPINVIGLHGRPVYVRSVRLIEETYAPEVWKQVESMLAKRQPSGTKDWRWCKIQFRRIEILLTHLGDRAGAQRLLAECVGLGPKQLDLQRYQHLQKEDPAFWPALPKTTEK